MLCGFVPALAASRTRRDDALKEGGRSRAAGASSTRLRSALVVAELAVALVLLTGAGLLLRSFQNLRDVDLGFRTDHTLTASFGLPRIRYSSQPAVDAFDAALLLKLRQLPQVQAVGVTTALPTAGGGDNTVFVPEDYVPPRGARFNQVWAYHVLGDYFQAAGIPLLRGRLFSASDNATAPLVAIVNRTLAEKYWPGQDPIGKRLHIGVKESPTPWMTVVGEIGDLRQTSAESAILSQMYTPASQFKTSIGQFAPPGMLNANYGSIVVRSPLPPSTMASSLRAVVRSIDPQLPLVHVESMDQVVAEGQASRRFNTVLISSFAAAAVLLALLGIYSVIAFSAAQRTREMAIRLALGAQRSALTRLVLTTGAKLGLAGCATGAIAAVFATRLLRSLLFEVNPLDPAVLALAAISMFALALGAALIPARRAASIEPMEALRTE